jgi:serine/threonine-protein kinase PknG
MDPIAHQRYTVRILTQALDVVTAGNAAALGAASSRPAPTVGSHPATEGGLREGLEKAYRALARDAPLREDRVELVNKANEVRSWTLT